MRLEARRRRNGQRSDLIPLTAMKRVDGKNPPGRRIVRAAKFAGLLGRCTEWSECLDLASNVFSERDRVRSALVRKIKRSGRVTQPKKNTACKSSESARRHKRLMLLVVCASMTVPGCATTTPKSLWPFGKDASTAASSSTQPSGFASTLSGPARA